MDAPLFCKGFWYPYRKAATPPGYVRLRSHMSSSLSQMDIYYISICDSVVQCVIAGAEHKNLA